MEAKEISQAVVSRLPRYFRYLGELKDEGVERISSQELSKLMRVTASQIRQDFNNFGGFGQQGYGYNVEYLYTEIGKILGLDQTHRLIIIGAGHLGQAIANYMNFERRGFLIKGLFDADPDLAGKMVRQIPVRPMEELEQFIQVNNIDSIGSSCEMRDQGDLEFRPSGSGCTGQCAGRKCTSVGQPDEAVL